MVEISEQFSFLESLEASSPLEAKRDSIGEHEDPWKSLGYGVESDLRIERKIQKRFGLEGTSRRMLTEETVRVALRHFELSGDGRFFSPEKVLEHLRAIGATGFQLEEGYEKLTPKEMWNYSLLVKGTIGRIALAQRFRGVLREVRAENAEYSL